MDTLEAEWKRVRPPNFWTTVREAAWPPFEFDATDRIATFSQEKHYVLLFQDEVGDNAFAEQNSGYLNPFLRVLTCYVVKESADLQRQAARAAVTMQALYLGNPDRVNPDYTGSNDWGLMTIQTPGTRIRIRRPMVAGDYGVSFVWGSFDVGYRHPWPKG